MPGVVNPSKNPKTLSKSLYAFVRAFLMGRVKSIKNPCAFSGFEHVSIIFERVSIIFERI